jgi:hypothetical protein
MKVKTDPRTFNVSKIAPTVIARIQSFLESRDDDPPRARKKWLEIVDLEDGERFAVSCHEDNGVIVITNVRISPERKGQPWK